MALVKLKKYQIQILNACFSGNLDCFDQLRKQIDNLWVDDELWCDSRDYNAFLYLGSDANLTNGKYLGFTIEDVLVWFSEDVSPRSVELMVVGGAIDFLDVDFEDMADSGKSDFEKLLTIERVAWSLNRSDVGRQDKQITDNPKERNFEEALMYLYRTYEDEDK